jgi:hypothetical protein
MALEELSNNGIKRVSKVKEGLRKKQQWYNVVLGSNLQSTTSKRCGQR